MELIFIQFKVLIIFFHKLEVAGGRKHRSAESTSVTAKDETHRR